MQTDDFAERAPEKLGKGVLTKITETESGEEMRTPWHPEKGAWEDFDLKVRVAELPSSLPEFDGYNKRDDQENGVLTGLDVQINPDGTTGEVDLSYAQASIANHKPIQEAVGLRPPLGLIDANINGTTVKALNRYTISRIDGVKRHEFHVGFFDNDEVFGELGATMAESFARNVVHLESGDQVNVSISLKGQPSRFLKLEKS